MAASIQTLSTWAKATAAWEEAPPGEALSLLLQIQQPSSKILFNIGCAYKRLGSTTQAQQTFTGAIAKDEHMAIAYYQRGCVQTAASRFQEAVADFDACQRCFRSRSVIDYAQLGLHHKLYVCEARHNCGVAEAMRGNTAEAEEHIEHALKAKVELRHTTFGDSLLALQSGKMPSLIELPHSAIYRPPQSKVANLGHKDYMGKAKVISAVNHNDKFSGFVGPQKIEEQRRLSPTRVSPVSSPVTSQRARRGGVSHARSPSPSPALGLLEGVKQLVSPPRTPPRHLRVITAAQRGAHLTGDRLLKSPQRDPPALPPKGDALQAAAAGTPRDAATPSPVCVKLPPPPSRPPPKLDRGPLPRPPSEFGNQLAVPSQAVKQ